MPPLRGGNSPTNGGFETHFVSKYKSLCDVGESLKVQQLVNVIAFFFFLLNLLQTNSGQSLIITGTVSDGGQKDTPIVAPSFKAKRQFYPSLTKASLLILLGGDFVNEP